MAQQNPNATITDTNLDEFKKLVRKAIFLTKEEENIFKAVPNALWREIFAKNFDGNFEYSKRLLLNQFKEIDKLDTTFVNREKQKIHNLQKATDLVLAAYAAGESIVYITDFDNDGSLAQSIIGEYLEIDSDAQEKSILEYAQTMQGGSRGINLEHLKHVCSIKGIDAQDSFLVITADNGINSRQEVKEIQQYFPNAKIIITDHHNPDEHMVVEENDKCVIFNPHYKPTNFFEKYNISGATTVGVLLLNVLNKRLSVSELEGYKNNIEKINTLFKVSNMLDYVDTHAADKPEKDYIISKFLKLQPLLNINNSISKIIVGEVTSESIAALEKKIPNLDVAALLEEVKNIHTQNHVARVLLNINKTYAKRSVEENLTNTHFQSLFLSELTKQEYFLNNEQNINPNYIEQLRPLIFSFAADYDKNTFLDAMADQMEKVFESIRISERLIGQALRAGEVITKQKLPHSTIAYADEHILSVFNRKFLNKVYNDENPGFALTLDSIKPSRVSGSFRSIFDIDQILPAKQKLALEKKLNIKIETPGHKKAAGFIIISRDAQKYPITEAVIAEINELINSNIDKIKNAQTSDQTPYLLTDFNSINLLDRINKVVRGNISNFSFISPIIKLTADTVWTDAYTTQQLVLKDIVDNKKYGYVTINLDFHGSTIIVPVELIRKIVDSNYEDYLSLGYMDGGVFMVDKVVKKSIVNNVVDLTRENKKEQLIERAWQDDFMDKNLVSLSRNQIKDNPFFKYHDYGNLNFDLFERIVIGIIDSNQVDMLSIFDVEANGFANSKIINFGATNYFINSKSGNKIEEKYFYERFYHTPRGEEYLLESDDISGLRVLSEKEKQELPLELKKQLLIKYDLNDESDDFTYYIHKDAPNFVKQKKLPFTQIKNYLKTEDGFIVYNREIEATMIAHLIKDADFKMPQEMINLTGITQRLLDIYGQKTTLVDTSVSEYYKGKKVLFGAHNTPYDARVLRANLPLTYEVLKKNKLYDSALFAKEQKLAYDDVKVGFFEDVDGLPSNVYFYNNEYSDFSLIQFLRNNKNGYFPDRSGQYLLEIDNTSFYLVDKKNHEKIKINTDYAGLLENLRVSSIPNISVKYSVEKLSEQWMIHSLLLCNEKFNIQYVDLSKYPELISHKDALDFFQDNYHFDISESKNIINFKKHYSGLDESFAAQEQLRPFVKEFLDLNKEIQQKFSDAWMYKKVLEIKDPTRLEITNDLIELVHYQTNIPKDKIKRIFDDAIVFKEKYKISHILHHEAHANGPYKEDDKGDVAFEDKLTLGLLSQREYNSYEHNVKHAVDYFNQVKIRARVAFEIADKLSDDAAQDSYSFRQGIMYNRDDLSPTISKIQEKEKALSNNTQSHVVKFKLDNDVLPTDSAVYALAKKHVVLSRKDIEEHKKKLSFILLYLQTQNTLSSDSGNLLEKKSIKKILDSNYERALLYKQQLSDIYDYVEFNRRDDQIKKVIEKCKKMLFDVSEKKNNKLSKLNAVDFSGIVIIEQIVGFIIKEMQVKDLDDELKQNIRDVKNLITQLKLNHQSTDLENAIDGAKDFHGFGQGPDISEKNFLHKVDILKQNLGKKLLTENLDLRFMNSIVEYNKDLIKPKKMKNGI